ncbi:MAG TPA: FKBP-type peptidyl-prolyl cis-trans isomerase [Deltaproteobacteria bacterium]|nr:FKBP-type peptidyl-prolyl cis-trans isomerase [Deltaproteobacteria bacterium]HPJ95388.1 FKBP-type peptidyl-prolyl cis-trans isomerase [Deltaproteobacteria bacterium]HPR53286.1 FKBP-type peptidyl-prolyl cis-trans isomerase [Deltaproteobacteria bacterium]
MDRTAKDGDTVKVHYAGKYESGEEFDSSIGSEPLKFTIGGGEVIPGFEEAAVGMGIGEKKSITIAPEEGYGEYNENLVIDMPAQYFPEDISPTEGLQLKIVDENEEEVLVVVTEVNDEYIRLDANHPLAGKTLVFDIELLEIL